MAESPVIQQHFVTFFSPGTFVAEQSRKDIASWDVPTAIEMSKAVTERYGATPYGFRFTTRGRGPDDLDSRELARSPLYYIGCKIETVEEVEARNDPKENILRANMQGNGYARIAVTTSGWLSTHGLCPGDMVLNDAGEVIHTEPEPSNA